MRKLLVFVLLLLSLFPIFSDQITFSAAESSVRLKDGRENVTLSGSAEVSTGSLTINADYMTLSGEQWRYIECSGNITIRDSERNLEIRTSVLWYDRMEERLLISSYFEIEDRINEMSARASHLEYDMKNEILTLSSQVSFSKINEDDVIIGSSERLSYDREREMLILSGSCRVIYDGDEYRAEQITIDMESDSISLNTSIRGQING